MERSEATFESFDGVEHPIEGGFVIRCETLQVSEAVRFMRMMSSAVSDLDVHLDFVREFPERVGIADKTLAELGIAVDHAGESLAPALNLASAFALFELLALAESGEPDAQLAFLDRFPTAVGVDELTPYETFELGRTFAQQTYTLIYGIASDFLYSLIVSPAARTRTRATRTSVRRASTT